MAVIASVFAFTACEEDIDLGFAKLSLDPLELNFGPEENSASISIIATRDWKVTTELPDWISLSATTGQADIKPQTITVTVLENKGNDRETTIHLLANTEKGDLVVKQKGALGEVKKGSGTKEDPYTVAGVRAYVEELGADVQSPKSVYVKGIISDVATTFEASGNYGNASFYMVDAAGDTDTFYAFQTYYLGNRKWKSGDTDVKAGDEVIIFGPVVNYKGNTPETVGKGASFVYSLNGKSDGGDEPVNEGTAKGKGTLEEPYNPAGAAAFAKSLGADVQSDKVYIKGKVSKVGTTFEASGNYGNATFNIVDAEDGTGDFYVFQTYYLGNRQWKSGDTEIKEGDIVIIYGPVVNYKGNTPETVGKGASFIYSLNGKTEGGNNPPAEETQANPAGDGTQASPFNVSAAINKAKEVGKTATEQDFYVKGKVSKISEQFGAAFGNGTFELIDEGFTAVFTAYRILYLGNKKWEEGDATVAVGDELVAVGKIVNYNEKTPEITQGGYLYSLNGQTSIAQGNVFEVEKTEIKVSASATSAEIKVKGNVSWTVSRKPDQVSCNPTSGEGTGSVTVTFAANESTENEVGYTIALSTEADVTNKTILVNIIQSKASVPGQGGTITIALNNATTFAEDNGGDVLKTGFAATVDGFKVATYQYKSTTKPVTPDQYSMRVYKSAVFYIEAPSGKTINALVFKANNYDNGKYILDLTGVEGTAGTATADKTAEIIKWEGNASTVILQAAAGQTRLENVEVYYE